MLRCCVRSRMILFTCDHRTSEQLHWLYMRHLRAQKPSHPINTWPRQPAYFEPSPTVGSLQLLRSPHGQPGETVLTPKHSLISSFSSAGDVCPWQQQLQLPQPELGPEQLVCRFRMWRASKNRPICYGGDNRGGWDGEENVRSWTWCIPRAARPRHLCLISDERVQVRCRRRHRTFRLGKPAAAAMEARVAYIRAILGCPDQWLDPLAWRDDLENHWLGTGIGVFSRGVGLSQTSYQSPEEHGLPRPTPQTPVPKAIKNNLKLKQLDLHSGFPSLSSGLKPVIMQPYQPLGTSSVFLANEAT